MCCRYASQQEEVPGSELRMLEVKPISRENSSNFHPFPYRVLCGLGTSKASPKRSLKEAKGDLKMEEETEDSEEKCLPTCRDV